tara:strand:- start:183 stop:632 length:450 start_codon:yes stop_codon:yes gene_type:complete
MIDNIPLPVVDNPIDAPFWSNAADGKLAVQICSSCNSARFPPGPYCSVCQSPDHQWHVASGIGTIWSYVIPHAPLLPAFSEQLPYIVALVELNDYPGVRLVGAITESSDAKIQGVDGSRVAIGDSVRAVFSKMDDQTYLLRWRQAVDIL